jgi:hypothetical protein
MMPPQTGLEIILKAVFLQGFRPFDRLRAGDRELDGVPHKDMRLSKWKRAGERRLVRLLREDSEMQPASNLDGL